jgi:hypothetical protein
LEMIGTCRDGARWAQSFFTAQFPWCSFRKRTKSPAALFSFFSFFFLRRARSVSGGFEEGTVMITCRVVTHLFRLARKLASLPVYTL